MKIIKRNGNEVKFDKQKIVSAISRANAEVDTSEQLKSEEIKRIANEVETKLTELTFEANVEDIQNIVEDLLMVSSSKSVARKYITYRYTHGLLRDKNSVDDKILSLIEFENEDVKQENSNKDCMVSSVQRDYMAGEVSKDLTMRRLLPKDVVDAHNEGIIHFHDADYYAQYMYNCCLINLEDMLQNGTMISGTKIDKPKSFLTACTITTQIIAQVASNQYGGQSITLSHLAPFVDISRQKIHDQVLSEMLDNDLKYNAIQISNIVNSRLRSEIKAGVQTIQYQIVTLMTTNGQAPFITVFMYIDEVPEGQLRDDLVMIIEEMLHQRIQGVKNGKGVYVTPAFPKLIYVLDEDNIHQDGKYFHITKLAAKCTAKRMVPDYISAKMMKQLKVNADGTSSVYTAMGCRSFLTPDRSGNGFNNISKALNYDSSKPKFYGRFNQGVVTINLVDVGLSANKDLDRFWEILDERLELCHKALKCRHERLEGTVSDVAPILWQNGAIARLEKGEKIDPLLHGGYSTISLGYAGLWECVYSLIEKKLTEPQGEELGLEIMKKLNEYTAKWKAAEDIDYSLYGTPIESTTYKFAKCLKKRFGIVPGVTDKNYITNSYHVHVTEKIDAFDKLALESKFQALSPGGAISYIEVPNMQNNIEAVLTVMGFIYENIMYAELNTKSDYCQVCGYDGEIEIVEDEDGKLIWRCPNCGNEDQNKMNVTRRTCGYLGTQFWNQGRTQEIKERVLHL